MATKREKKVIEAAQKLYHLYKFAQEHELPEVDAAAHALFVAVDELENADRPVNVVSIISKLGKK